MLCNMETTNKIWRCYYCHKKIGDGNETLQHVLLDHNGSEIVLLCKEAQTTDLKPRYTAKHFGIVPNELSCDFSGIKLDEGNMLLTLPQGDSPLRKAMRENTPTKSVCSRKELFQKSLDIPPPTQRDQIVSELSFLLPEIVDYLSETDRLQEWRNFMEQLALRKFPLNNIAFQLFLDVVNFLQNGNIHSMRYSKTVKQFWSVGYRLFRGKFLRFMGGYKSLGQMKEKRRHCLDPCDTKINFVCPDVKLLRKETEPFAVECESPGILTSNIEAFSKQLNGASCKLSFDGKKLAMGYGYKHGDVDLFGNESAPTLNERRRELAVQMEKIESLQNILEHVENKSVFSLPTENDDSLNERIRYLSTDLIKVLSSRVRHLRCLKVKKTLTHDRLLKDGPINWRESKYVFVLSGLKTAILRLEKCIEDLLDALDGIAALSAATANCLHLFSYKRVVNLSTQRNYICLTEDPSITANLSENDLAKLSKVLKQRSDSWFKLRRCAKVTGSTIYDAVGLSTQKKQREHFDFVMNGKPKPTFSRHVQECMKHGADNEIHAIATIVGKILPSIRPDITFREEGCYVEFVADKVFMVVSPDGGGIRENNTYLAFEIKCPYPGKNYTTDVHYNIPKYYVSQLLAEMWAMGCEELYYVCYTAESTTVHIAKFDSVLWNRIWDLSLNIYKSSGKLKSCNNITESCNLTKAINIFLESKVSFVGEFKSCEAVECGCLSRDGFRNHGIHSSERRNETLDVRTARKYLLKGADAVTEAYNLTRLPAKEILVVMISDMHRMRQSSLPHAVPIAYGFSGFSLKTECLISLLNQVLEECQKHRIHVAAVSSDGQFHKLCVRAPNGDPLTILQLAKDMWQKVKKVSKAEQINQLMNMNAIQHGSGYDNIDFAKNVDSKNNLVVFGVKNKSWQNVYTPTTLRKMTTLWKKSHTNQTEIEGTKVGESESLLDNDDHIFHLLPEKVLNSLNDIVVEKLKELNRRISSNDPCPNGACADSCDLGLGANILLEVDQDNQVNSHCRYTNINTDNQNDCVCSTNECDDMETEVNRNSGVGTPENIISLEVVEDILEGLREQEKVKKKPTTKWETMSVEELSEILTNPKKMCQKMTKENLSICIKRIREAENENIRKEHRIVSSMSKLDLVNMFADMTQKERIVVKKTPPPLRRIIKDILSRKYPKCALNAIYAVNKFGQEVTEWRKHSNTFAPEITVGESRTPFVFFSQLNKFDAMEQEIAYLLDCHHLFVNIRCLVCRHGIKRRGIDKNAWLEVAKRGRTDLSIAMISDVIDPQSNECAQICFSQKVEQELSDLGFLTEAEFCSIFREWYEAEDKPGLSVQTRLERRLRMRNWLIAGVNLSDFPPPGMYVAGLTAVQFEGLLTNIDRRIQLSAMVNGCAYNVRSPNTLDSENFFGEFQELDPKGTGVLTADDAPHALATASYLLHSRVDPDRDFFMRTSKTERVYRVNKLSLDEQNDCTLDTCFDHKITHIDLRNHSFDEEDRVTRHPKRKRANISSIDKPARGTAPIRLTGKHKKDESQVLPHIRYGIDL